MYLLLLMSCFAFCVAAVVIYEGENPQNPAKQAAKRGPGQDQGSSVGQVRSQGRIIAVLEPGPMQVPIRPNSGAGSGVASSAKIYPLRRKGGIVAAFDIFFQPGFEWSCRGKVGGLFVGTGAASGGRYSTDGASHRLMWEGNGDAFSYVYVPLNSYDRQPPALRRVRSYGQGVFEDDFRGALKTGVWHHVELGVRLNSVGRSDGALLLSVDGKTRVLEGVMWRYQDLDIQGFHINVFHGGGCLATRNSSLTLKNIETREW